MGEFFEVTFIFYRTLISTTVPISDDVTNEEQAIEIANQIISEDWDIDSVGVCQDIYVREI